MKNTLIVAVLLGLLVLASAHRHHGEEGQGQGHGKGHHNKENKHHKSACSYKNTNGHSFDLSRLASYETPNWKDMIVKDMMGGSTYHYNPCGAVHATECPTGAAVCEITNKGEAISHGLASDAHWADGAESGATVEITYGGGELCTEGEHRKTAVELRCLTSASPSSPSFLMGVVKEDCLLKLIVESPLACDKQTICSALITEDSCIMNRDLCEWNSGSCVASSGQHKWSSGKRLTTFIVSAVIGFGAVVFLCCAVTCACVACRRAAQRRKLRGLPTHKKAKKASKKAPAPAEEELNLIAPETFESAPMEAHYPFQPFAMQQAADGSFVPVPMPMSMSMPMSAQQPPHAYSYPMVQVIPAYHLQQQ